MLSSIVVSFIAIFALAMSQNKHFKVLFKRQLTMSVERILSFLGWFGLLLSQGLLFQEPNIGLSYLYWLSWLSISIVIISLVLSYFHKAPRRG